MRALVLLVVAVAITAAHANVKEEEYLTEKEQYLAEKEQYLTEKEQYLTDQEYDNSLVRKEQNVQYLTDQERNQAMDEAIGEAMVAMVSLEASTIENRNRVSSNNQQEYTSIQLLHKFFKRPSEEAKKMGKENRLYRDIVDRAERKMIEVKRAKVAMSQGNNAMANSQAEILYHRPGSIVTSNELTRAWRVARSVVGTEQEVPTCDFETVDLYRTIDGRCNNKNNPLFGSSGIPFKRIVKSAYEDGVSSLRGTTAGEEESFSDPSARLVSEKIVNSSTDNEIPFTHLLMQFGQFLDHDIDLGPEESEESGKKCDGCAFSEFCQPIKVSNDDPAFGTDTRNNANCIPLRRSVSALSQEPPKKLEPWQQVNDVTSFIDGSMIYGSRLCLSLKLRLKTKGLLLEGSNIGGMKPALPFDMESNVLCPQNTPCFLCGDVRCNEQISLTIMHTLWLREHNRCAREMTNVNPRWDDEQLYQECRKIVGALIQKITYEDYLPKILGSEFTKYIGDHVGYNSNADATIPNSFATAAYRYGHSLILPFFERLGSSYESIGRLGLVEAFFSPNRFETVGGTDPIMRGWVTVNSRRMDEFMNTVLTTQLFQTSTSPGLDLASLNMQRGRDHGLPKYSVFREFCLERFGLPSEIEKQNTLDLLNQLYGSVDEADVWLAGLAEKRLKDGLLGPTFACIFGLTFQALRDGDRFFWENKNVFTPLQKKSIEGHSFSRVICDNSDNITNIQPDAFVSNQIRIPCSEIGRVNLDLFKENDCHIRVRIDDDIKKDPYTTNTVIIRRGERDFTNLRIRPTSVCIPIDCPIKTKCTQVVFLLSKKFIVRPNEIISSNPNRTFQLGQSLLFSDSGVYATERGCNSSEQVGFSIEFSPSVSEPSNGVGKLASEIANANNVLKEDMQELESEKHNAMLEKVMKPDDILNDLHKLESKNNNAALESTMEETPDLLGNAEVTKQQDVKESSLFSELEEALK